MIMTQLAKAASTNAPQVDTLAFMPSSKPPLYFGITRPIGTPMGTVLNALTHSLTQAKYRIHIINLAALINQAIDLESDDDRPPREDRYAEYIQLMRKGDFLRAGLGTSVAADLAIVEISSRRATDLLTESTDGLGNAYLITSLVHPDEVDRLRDVYGTRFFVIGVNAPLVVRRRVLSDRLKINRSDKEAESRAESLIQIDSGLKASAENTERRDRLNVDRTFQEADVFVTVDTVVSDQEPTNGNPAKSNRDSRSVDTLGRFLGQVFGYPFGTLSLDEQAMGGAYSAAKQSAALGRSVGAAIADARGAVLATGFNEVARAGGGQYRQGDNPDNRDHKIGFDPSDHFRLETMQSFLDVFFAAHEWLPAVTPALLGREGYEWFTKLAATSKDLGAPPQAAIRRLPALEQFANSRITNLIEFGRSVHAEMSAVTEAAYRGIPIAQAKLYVTTFPCHECSRNIIAAGIERVVYVEPYGKSLAERLYDREIVTFDSNLDNDTIGGGDNRRTLVAYEPYVGIAPKRFDQLFSSVSRKYGIADDTAELNFAGEAVGWTWQNSLLRPSVLGYRLPASASGTDTRCIPDLERALLARESYFAEATRRSLEEIKRKLTAE